MYIRFMIAIAAGKRIILCGSIIECELSAWTQIKAFLILNNQKKIGIPLQLINVC